jgi:hypothetical protein
MTTMAEVWRDAMYEGAREMWPDLTPRQYGDATRAWISRQPKGLALSLRDVAVGLEQELRDRYGPPGQAAP